MAAFSPCPRRPPLGPSPGGTFCACGQGEETLQPALSGACANCLCASEKVSLRQSWKILRLISRRKLDTALPWVHCASGIQGLQFPMLGSLGFMCCVACDPIFEAASGVMERTLKNVAGKSFKTHPMQVLSPLCLPEIPCFTFPRWGPSLCLNASGDGNVFPTGNEASQRNCRKLH